MSFTDSLNSLFTLSSSSLAHLHLNPLYVLPVTAVLTLCLLVYAFGFKRTSPVPPSLHSLIDKDAKKNAPRKKNSGTRTATKSNGHVTAAGSGAGGKVKPKAVVQPMRQEPRAKKQKQLPALKNKSPGDLEVDDVDTGDWVPVISEKTKKKALKQKQEAVKVVPILPEQVIGDESGGDKKQEDEKEAEVAVADVPVKLEVENWDMDDPVVEKEYKAAENRVKKKNVKRGKEVRPELAHQTSLTQAPLSDGDVGKVVKDKITSEILASYDSVLDSEKTASAARKRKEKEKRKTKADPVSPNLQPEKPVNQKSGPVADGGQAPVVHEESGRGEDVSGQVPAAPENQAVKSTQSSETTDVTDGSDPSDGEFKVVRKRKARRE